MVVIRVVTVLDFGGVEKRMINIATSVPAGVSLIFVSLGKGGQSSAEIEALGHKVICLNHAFKIPNIALIFALVKLFKKIKPDVVHSSGAEANFHAQIAAWYAGIKKRISEEIGFPVHSAAARVIFKNVYRLSHYLVCISNAVAEKVISLKEIKQNKIAVVYNPIIIPANIKAHINKKGDFVFITVCRLTAVKNITSLIQAFAKLQPDNENIKLHIVGDGPDRTSLEAMAMQLAQPGSIVFNGFKTDVYNELAQADVFVLPSFSEGLGNAIMEAYIAGLPCIVSGVGGAAELVTQGVNGWVINPHDEGSLLNAMKQAVNCTDNELQQMGNNGKENIISNFSIDKHWTGLMKIYAD